MLCAIAAYADDRRHRGGEHVGRDAQPATCSSNVVFSELICVCRPEVFLFFLSPYFVPPPIEVPKWRGRSGICCAVAPRPSPVCATSARSVRHGVLREGRGDGGVLHVEVAIGARVRPSRVAGLGPGFVTRSLFGGPFFMGVHVRFEPVLPVRICCCGK